MRLLSALHSLKRAFAYFIGARPRVVVQKFKSSKSYKLGQARARAFRLAQNIQQDNIQKQAFHRNFLKVFLKNQKDDFRAVLNPIQEGPQVLIAGGVKYGVLHRVATRSFLQAISTTESIDVPAGLLDSINLTHSSIIDSDDRV